MFLVDSHCHLDGLDYQSLHNDVDDVLAKAAARDVKFCLAVATTLPGYRAMRELVGVRDNVVFSCGVHPLNQDEAYDVDELRRLAAEEGIFGGISSAGALVAALRVAERVNAATIVFIVCERGDRYLSTGVFN